MGDVCPTAAVATISSMLAFLLASLAAFGAYTILTPGWPYFVSFAAGASIIIAILSAMASYIVFVLLEGK